MFDIFNYVPFMFLIVLLIMFVASAVRILPEYERGVLFRLGRLAGARGPGLFFIIPGIDKLVRVSLRTVALDVPPQDVITHDNVTVKVSAVIYFRVIEPQKAIVEVENYLYATSQLAQTTLRSVLGQVELDELLANREKINKELQEILDRHTGPWGVKVTAVEVKNIDLPQEMLGPLPSRPRPSGSGGPRSSTPTANSRRRKSWPRRQRSWPPSPPRFSSVTSRPSPRWPRRRTPPPSSRFPSTSSRCSWTGSGRTRTRRNPDVPGCRYKKRPVAVDGPFLRAGVSRESVRATWPSRSWLLSSGSPRTR